MAKLAKYDITTWLNNQSQPEQETSNQEAQQIKYISVYDLIPNPKNFYEIKDIEKLAIEIELQGGIITPLEVKQVENNKFMIIAGHRRREAVLNLLTQEESTKITRMMPCFIKEYTDEQETLAIILSNRSQRVRTKLEELQEFQLLKPIIKDIFDKEKLAGNITGRFRAFCADFLGVSESTIHRMDSMDKLAPEIKQEINQGNITPTAALQLTNLSAADQKAVYEKQQEKGTTKIKDIQKVIHKEEVYIIDYSQMTIAAANKIKDMLEKRLSMAQFDRKSEREEKTEISEFIRLLNLLVETVDKEVFTVMGGNMFEE